MPLISDEAVVLARHDYSETSQVIVLLTRQHGKIRAIAKGIKRGTKVRFAVGLDLLDVGHVVFSIRREGLEGLATVTEWRQIRGSFGMRQRLFRIYAALYAAEVTASLTEDWDGHVGLFEALHAVLEHLSEAREPLGPLVVYQYTLLESVGLLPDFGRCMQCRRSRDLTYFSSFEGGMICRHCEPAQIEKWQVTPLALRLLQSLPSAAAAVGYARSDANDPVATLGGAFGVLNYHVGHLMGREPRLAAKLLPPSQRRTVT